MNGEDFDLTSLAQMLGPRKDPTQPTPLEKAPERAAPLLEWANQPSPSSFLGVLKAIGEILSEEASPTRPDVSVGMMPGLPNPRNLPLTKVMTGGKPTQVYHGTSKAFQEFDPKQAREGGLYGPGTYFTESPRVASGYASDVMSFGRAPNVRPAYLDIMNPFDSRAAVSRSMVRKVVKGIETMAVKEGYWSPNTPPKVIREWAARIGERLAETKTGEQFYRRLARELGEAEYPAKDWANQVLQAAGYDGITYPGGKIMGGEPHKVWVIFQPKQAMTPYEYKARLERTQHRD